MIGQETRKTSNSYAKTRKDTQIQYMCGCKYNFDHRITLENVCSEHERELVTSHGWPKNIRTSFKISLNIERICDDCLGAEHKEKEYLSSRTSQSNNSDKYMYTDSKHNHLLPPWAALVMVLLAASDVLLAAPIVLFPAVLWTSFQTILWFAPTSTGFASILLECCMFLSAWIRPVP